MPLEQSFILQYLNSRVISVSIYIGCTRAIERCMNIASIYCAINKNFKQYMEDNKAMWVYMYM